MAEHMDIESKLHHLTGLAREKSSERRRALLREVTDLFFADGPDGGTGAHQQFEAVLSALAAQTAQDARAELARPVDDILYFAGEASSSEFFSTCHGAYLTGIAQIEAIAARLRAAA